ncbi:hypothetical protein J4Q44_G00185500 [Coregonus suidteri]|uniref:Secreted protein n=1 Tax=Coregonus suidteri TaxID=861788 RepID=A0AAN8LQU6_9TELE
MEPKTPPRLSSSSSLVGWLCCIILLIRTLQGKPPLIGQHVTQLLVLGTAEELCVRGHVCEIGNEREM